MTTIVTPCEQIRFLPRPVYKPVKQNAAPRKVNVRLELVLRRERSGVYTQNHKSTRLLPEPQKPNNYPHCFQEPETKTPFVVTRRATGGETSI